MIDAPTLMLVGGGTGGHVFPGVAVGEAWLRRFPAGGLVYVGSPTGMEARVVPALGWTFVPVTARRLKNASPAERVRTLATMPGALTRGARIVARARPSVVLGVGGYVSGPVVMAAGLRGTPTAIAEQNARPGLTNRLLARVARRVYTAFPEAADHLPRRKVRDLGNPVRDAFRAAARTAAPAGAGRRVLILGGSQGARALNERLPPALAALRARFPDLQVVHQTGRDKDAPVRAAYAAAGWPEAEVVPFIDDVAGALVRADLVVARAGATTVAELACVGRPALFVPFPFAADDHQAANAASLVAAGGARMEREEALTADRLQGVLSDLLGDPDALAAMGRRARERGRPDAADAIVDDLYGLAQGSRA
jgi:UDP-N-acetylglucosamine--N-acetylmuramyl-(pentapeptide) pyrophosphoryl-undecaprenol N-acetylglucosamine transferase